MKGGIFIAAIVLVFVVASVAAFADYPAPNSYFVFKSITCLSDGSIIFNVTHSGESLRIIDLKTEAEGEHLAKQPLLGNWYREGNHDPINEINYTGSDFVSPGKFSFSSGIEVYTTGKYIITLSWPSTSIYYNTISFAVDCPGVPCTDDDVCIAQQRCVNKVCEWVPCAADEYANGHVCFKRCNDNNKCTDDYFINNECINAPQKGCCISDKDCNAYEKCSNNKCTKPLLTRNIFVRFWNWLSGSK